MKEEYHGKAIYQPSGKAAEYGEWACNFHIGCSNWCDYCYCSKALHPGLWSSTVTLKRPSRMNRMLLRYLRRNSPKIYSPYVGPDYFQFYHRSAAS